MSQTEAQVTSFPANHAGPSDRMAFAIALGLLAALLVLYWPTFASMLHLWSTSETYAHGFFVLPVSIYLAYRVRARFNAQMIAPSWPPLWLLLGDGLVWAFAHAASILVIEQYAAVVMIPLVVWAVFGWQRTKQILFPLGFLLLAVPVGDEFRPQLIEFVADFVVGALRLSGIPVYREGNFFIIPSGSWSVVQGCSGLRYLMATLTIGLLFAYMSYRSLWRRAVFVLFSLLVALLGNGMRAYMIVMIAHLSDRKLALGIDHYIYGWVFFGILIAIVMWVGSLWREPDAVAAGADAGSLRLGQAAAPGSRSTLGSAAVALILLGAWPMLAGIASGRGADPAPPIELPALVAGWTGGGDALTSWQPSFVGADQSASRTYRRDSAAVGVLAYVYSNQTQGAELINARNRLVVEKDPDWRMLSHGRGMTGVGLPIIETEIKTTRGDPEVLVWQTYWVGGRTTVDPIAIKLMDAINVLLGRARRAATVIYYTPATDDLDAARADLAAFAQAAGADVIAAVAAEKE